MISSIEKLNYETVTGVTGVIGASDVTSIVGSEYYDSEQLAPLLSRGMEWKKKFITYII